MRKIKVLGLMMAMAMLLTLLAGCSNAETKNTTAAAKGGDGQTTAAAIDTAAKYPYIGRNELINMFWISPGWK